MLIDEDRKKREDRIGLFLLLAVLLFFCGQWIYVYIYSGRDGYHYTIAVINNYCSDPTHGEGYILKYEVNGEILKTPCIAFKEQTDIGTKYLLMFAVSNPKYVSLLDYVPKNDSIKAPSGGWQEPPYEFFKEISR